MRTNNPKFNDVYNDVSIIEYCICNMSNVYVLYVYCLYIHSDMRLQKQLEFKWYNIYILFIKPNLHSEINLKY